MNIHKLRLDSINVEPCIDLTGFISYAPCFDYQTAQRYGPNKTVKDLQ